MKSDSKNISSSFRDPAGFVFSHNGKIYRQINQSAKKDYDRAVKSGLYKELMAKNLIVGHQEISSLSGFSPTKDKYKLIRPDMIPFISYPYEWSFSQLKKAALLTLRIQKLALAKGMVLKDASAYNIQFIGNNPIFIDTLSFAIYEPGSAWLGYKQYCQHFLAPLAIAKYSRPEAIKMLQIFIDGIPLELAAKLLPLRSRRRWGLLSHIYMHSAAQKRYTDNQEIRQPKKRQVSETSLKGIVNSLELITSKLNPPKSKTSWGEYYEFHNYSDKAFDAKKKMVSEFLTSITPKPEIVWDIGANDGTFSELAARIGAYCVAFDVDYQALEFSLKAKRSDKIKKLILPLHQDWTNPSPSMGWAHEERLSLQDRGPAGAILALAVVHHLAIGNNLPLPNIAKYFASLGKYLIIEYVPKSDSKVKLLLQSRVDIFDQYDQSNFEQAFENYFTLVKRKSVAQSDRVIYLYKAK